MNNLQSSQQPIILLAAHVADTLRTVNAMAVLLNWYAGRLKVILQVWQPTHGTGASLSWSGVVAVSSCCRATPLSAMQMCHTHHSAPPVVLDMAAWAQPLAGQR